MSLTKKERQMKDAAIPKCACGNNLSLKRVEDGIDCCPACDYKNEPTQEDRIKILEQRILDLEDSNYWLKEEIRHMNEV